MDQEFLHILGDLLLHLLQDPLGFLFGEVAEKVGRLAGGHLLDDVRGLGRVQVLDQADLDLGVGLLQGFGRRLHIQGLKDLRNAYGYPVPR